LTTFPTLSESLKFKFKFKIKKSPIASCQGAHHASYALLKKAFYLGAAKWLEILSIVV